MPHIIVDNSDVVATDPADSRPFPRIVVQGDEIFRERRQTITVREAIAGQSDGDIAPMAKIALRLLDLEPRDVAVIGLGMGILPRLVCLRHPVFVFEIEPELIDLFRQAHPWATITATAGDYEVTIRRLDRLWPVIVYDIGGEHPKWLLEHLTAVGFYLTAKAGFTVSQHSHRSIGP